MIEKLDSKIIALNNQKYLVYLKRVAVREGKDREIKTIIRAFVKKLDSK
jgi:hypothetical protein